MDEELERVAEGKTCNGGGTRGAGWGPGECSSHGQPRALCREENLGAAYLAEKKRADDLEALIANAKAMFAKRMALSEELLGPMGAVPYVMPIQDAQAALEGVVD